MKTVQRFFSKAWRPALLLASIGLIAYLLYFHRLGTLVPGYAPQEVATYQSAQSWHQIIHNPLNAPYKIGVWALAATGHHHLLATRIVAALCGIGAVMLFYSIVKAWYGFRVGFLSSILFATSAGFLHVARLGTPLVLQMGILALAGSLLWHRYIPRLHPYLTYVVLVVFGIGAYIPGLVWFELLLVVLMHRAILRHWKRSAPTHRIAWIALGFVAIAPLLYGIGSHPKLILELLGLPPSLPALQHVPSNLIDSVLSLGVRSDGNALLWLGHSPLLSVIELILGALGVYYYVYQQRTLRSLMLAGAGIIGIVLISLGGSVSITCIIPVAYLLVASGLNHFLGEWMTVFPRNPIARVTGTVLICIMLFFSALYHTRSYFIAWPHHSATRQVFSIPPQ
jgi:hypothetical protein